ncbi:uncharacterized protein LOC134848689 [Symsagittifera roscoffensis]|uniref:uncharacterized protein LOC134848689 n=1 Tax=Symsagittifera roscoffensis TaxID=84072 RepID=UPI00307BA238
MISEIRSEQEGIIWLGDKPNQAVVIHSQKCGVLLLGDLLEDWIASGQQKSFSERVTAVQIGRLRLIATYQPLWSKGPEEIEKFRKDLENELARTPKESVPILGGDWNAQVGRGSQRQGISGKYGLKTETNEAGESLLDWCEEHQLQHVNSYFPIRSRGTWFNQMHRHRLGTHEKQRNGGSIPQEDGGKLNKKNDWDSISRKLTETAEEVCGTKKRKIANPWTVGYEEELRSLHTEISTEVMRRNELISQTLGESHGMLADALTASRGRLVAARKKMKKRLRQLERQWWDEIIIECKNAAEKGDMGTMYKTLRKLGTRSQKHQTGTTISTDEFKAHFSNVSKDRNENDPGTLMNTVKQMPDESKDVKFITANQKLNTLPSEKEIMEALDEMRESAPGKDGVRMVYIRNAYWKWREKVIHLVMRMFTTRADLWEESLKKGQIVLLHKTGNINDANNLRVVCLLSMASRILARRIANHLRTWSEELQILDENQSGFRPGRSTADASLIFIRIREDVEDLRRRRIRAGISVEVNTDREARLIDLTKAYPRVSKPVLWAIFRRYAMEGPFLDTLMDLHEATTYSIKGKEGDSEEWTPERGLREGCPSSPSLFNKYHQVVMRQAEKARLDGTEEKGTNVRIAWTWMPENHFPGKNMVETHNTETQTAQISLSLFADDTTPIGEKEEIESVTATIKEVMKNFEEKNNEEKEEKLKFGKDGAGGIRMLGVWIGAKQDIKNRKRRAGGLWAKVKRRLTKSRLPKRIQARVVQCCVESGLLFDANVRTWKNSELQSLQSFIDRCYRHVWSSKSKPPLIEMQEKGVIMQDIRNQLNIKTIRWKVEGRTLKRIGHVMRMDKKKD